MNGFILEAASANGKGITFICKHVHLSEGKKKRGSLLPLLFGFAIEIFPDERMLRARLLASPATDAFDAVIFLLGIQGHLAIAAAEPARDAIVFLAITERGKAVEQPQSQPNRAKVFAKRAHHEKRQEEDAREGDDLEDRLPQPPSIRIGDVFRDENVSDDQGQNAPFRVP